MPDIDFDEMLKNGPPKVDVEAVEAAITDASSGLATALNETIVEWVHGPEGKKMVSELRKTCSEEPNVPGAVMSALAIAVPAIYVLQGKFGGHSDKFTREALKHAALKMIAAHEMVGK